ncbi:MAG: MFS transporter [Oscillospiraceae bacterium]|nr:MFS transporter [Oscillospiraceae bacterium]
MKQKKRLHYAWVIFVVCFLMAGCSLGFISTPVGLYLKPISDSLQISRAAYAVRNSMRFITTALVNIFFGKLITKFGARKLGTAGLLALAASCLVSAQAKGLFMLYLGGVLQGIGFSWTCTTMVGYVVEKWFSSKKGTIMGLILASNGLLGAISVQILSPMIYGPNEAWRTSYLVCAAIMTGLAILVVLFLRTEPKDKGMTPLGSGQVQPHKQRGRDWAGVSSEEIFRSSYFYVCAVCVFLTGMLLHATGNVSAAHMEDRGISAAIITNISSISSLVLLCSKMLTGISFDKFGLRFTMTICNLFAVVAIVLLAFVQGPATAYASGIFKALSLPLETIMLPLIAAELFGRKSYAHMMGLLVSFNTLGYAVGGPVINLFYDLTGSYVSVMLALGGIMIAVSIAMQYCISTAHKIRKEQEA